MVNGTDATAAFTGLKGFCVSSSQTDPSREELRIVMVGKTGVGKSKTGNTILGQRCFESKFSATSVTAECCKGVVNVDGQTVTVIDTPGLFDTKADHETTSRDIAQCVTLSAPGPHVFLVVIMLGRFTQEETQTVQMIQEMFGLAADKYSMVLFTYGDLLHKTTIEEFLNDCPDLYELVQRCNGQYHVFNNEVEDRSQVTKLFKKIRNMVQENGGSHYTNEMFQEAERLIEEEKERILMEKEEEIRKEEEELKQRLQVEYEDKLRRLIQQQRCQFLGEEEKGGDMSYFKTEEDTQREKMREERKKKETEWKREDEMERQKKELKREKKEKEAEWRRMDEVEKEREDKEKEWREMEEIKREEEEIKREKMTMQWMEREEETTPEMEKRMKGEQNYPDHYPVDRREEDERKRMWKKGTTGGTGEQSQWEKGMNQQMSMDRGKIEIEQRLQEEHSRRLQEGRENLIKGHELEARKDAEKRRTVWDGVKKSGRKFLAFFKLGK